MAVWDANLMFRTTGSLTQSESKGPLTVHGMPLKGMSVRVSIPQAGGADDTILPKLYASTDGSTYNLVAQYREGAKKIGVAGGDLYMPIPYNVAPKGQKTYLKLELVVTGTTTNFGVVMAGIVMGGGASIDRSVSWTK